MANKSEASTFDFTIYIGYLVSGSLLIFFNALIVLTVLVYKKLRSRKEYFLMMAIAQADLWNGVGYFMAGAMRINLILDNKHLELRTPWQCLIKPYNLIWVWAEPASYIMLVCISVDRIISVLAPIYYFKAQISYTYKLMVVFWGWAIIGALFAALSSLTTPENVKYEALCFTMWALGPSFQPYYELLPIICGISSVLLYVLVPIIYKRKKAQVNPANNQQAINLNLQKRVSVTMGIAAACTAVFFLTPKFVYSIVSLSYENNIPNEVVMQIAPPIYLIPHINPLCNFALYTWRHMKFRKALSCFLKCKPLPGNFNSLKG